jgi:CubicO group peptidase (beta-lactamase class C family)
MKYSKRLLKIFIPIISIIITIVFTPWLVVRAWLAPLPNTIQEQLDNALSYKLDGIIVYVDQLGKPPAFYTAGWKDREDKIPADPQALFKIGSISKLYIAAATAKIINGKSLSLEDTLAKLLPELVGRI